LIALIVVYFLLFRLDQALSYRQFNVGVEEEETWIQEKEHLLSATDYGEVLAIVQVSSTQPLLVTPQ